MKVFSYSIWSIHYYVCWSCKAEWRDTLIEDTYRSSIIIYCKSTIFDCTKTFPLPLKKMRHNIFNPSIDICLFIYHRVCSEFNFRSRSFMQIRDKDFWCSSGTIFQSLTVFFLWLWRCFCIISISYTQTLCLHYTLLILYYVVLHWYL